MIFGEIILFFAALLSLVFRLLYVSHFNFAFTIDQAKDILEIRRLAIGHEMVFLGPSTSLNGVYYGPFWFYYNLPAFLLGKGDPTALVYWEIILYALVISSFFLYFRKKLPQFALISGLFLLISPRLLGATSYALNSNSAPAFVLLFILLLYHALQKKTPALVFWLGLLAGITLQIEIFGALMFPLGLYWLYRYKIKRKILYLSAFCLTLAPQIIFEIKHNFIMTKVFITEFAGHGDILGDKISLSQKIVDRLQHYLAELGGSFPFPAFIFVLALVILLYISIRLFRHQQKHPATLIFNLSLSLLLISAFFFLVYPYPLKDWMTINFVIPYILIFSVCLAEIWQTKRVVLRLVAAATISFAILGGLSLYKAKLIEKINVRSADPGSLANQIEAIDWVYQQANGEAFKLYDYTPAVYDYNYQYLFWWYGTNKYGYQPSSITYQDNAPEYIRNNNFYWLKQKTLLNGYSTFLIIEPDSKRPGVQSAWVDRYASLCLISNKVFPSMIQTQLRKPCPIKHE